MQFPPRPCCFIRSRKVVSAAASRSARPLLRKASSQYTSHPSWRRPSTYCKYTQKCPPPSGNAATLNGAMTTVGIGSLTLVRDFRRDGQHRFKFPEPLVNLSQRVDTPRGAVCHQRNRRPDDPIGEARI